MEEKTFATLLFTVLLLNSYVLLSTAASGRKLLNVEEEMMDVARRMNAEHMKDYVPVEANPRHNPDQRDPDLDPPSGPHDNPPPDVNPPPEIEPPVETDPPRDRSGIYHHVHHQSQQPPGLTPLLTPVDNPAPAPTTTAMNNGVRG